MSSMRELEPAESDVLDTSAAGPLAVRGSALRAGAFVLTSAISLIGVAVLTRYLDPDRFGQYQTILSLMIVASGLSDLGMATLVTREYAQRAGEERWRTMRVLYGLRLVLTFIGTFGALVFAAAAGYSPVLVAGTLLASIALLLTVVQTTLATPMGAELKLGTLAAMDVVRQVMTTAIIVGIALGGGGVALVLAAGIPVQFVLIIWTWTIVRGKMPAIPAWDPAAWKGLAVASVGFALAMASGTIYQNLAQILTSLVATDLQTGLFSVAFRVFMVAGSVPFLLVGSAFPILARAARDDKSRLHYALARLTQVSLLVGGAGALLVFFAATSIIDVLGGPSYADSVPVLRILAVAMFAGFAITSWGFGLLSLHRHRSIVLSNLLAMGVMGTLVVALASSSLGAKGAAIAVLAGELCIAAGYAASLGLGKGRMRLAPIESTRTLLAIGIAFLAGIAAPLPAGVAVAVVVLIVYVTSAILLRAIPAEAVDVLPAAIRGRAPRWMFAD